MFNLIGFQKRVLRFITELVVHLAGKAVSFVIDFNDSLVTSRHFNMLVILEAGDKSVCGPLFLLIPVFLVF